MYNLVGVTAGSCGNVLINLKRLQRNKTQFM